MTRGLAGTFTPPWRTSVTSGATTTPLTRISGILTGGRPHGRDVQMWTSTNSSTVRIPCRTAAPRCPTTAPPPVTIAPATARTAFTRRARSHRSLTSRKSVLTKTYRKTRTSSPAASRREASLEERELATTKFTTTWTARITQAFHRM